MQAYYPKCRANGEMKDAGSTTLKHRRLATRDVCPVCGTEMVTLLIPCPIIIVKTVKSR